MVKSEQKIALVIHNVRSALNVGSMLRTAEGFGVSEVVMTGYTPYPESKNDSRLPHHRQKIALQIHKTALGAENFLKWQHISDIKNCLNKLSQAGYLLVALEQSLDANSLDKFRPIQNIALIVGNEITGLDDSVLKSIDKKVQIPMSGHKESFNVAIAAGVALYHLKYGAAARQK
jgi:23S rRNA (guanosine2251-2'-O)-methyltransferase